jgi:predicted enzyme related to lactoylglutathione lyase
MRIKAFDSICIWSEDPDKLAKFYEEKLGLQIDSRIDIPRDKGISFKINDVVLFIGYHDQVKGRAKDPYRIMPGFVVDSVKETYEELAQKGVEFILPASSSPDSSYWVATALDPEGNIIQFFSFDKP